MTRQPPTDPNPLPRAGTGFFPVGDSGVVFSEASQNLFALDPLAAFCWLGLEAGHGIDEMAGELAEAGDGDTNAAVAKIESVVASFSAADLLDDGSPARPPARPEQTEIEVSPPADLEALLAKPVESVFLRVLGSDIRLDFGTERLAERFRPIVESLAGERPTGSARPLAIVESEGVAYGCDLGDAVYSSRSERTTAAVVERLVWRGALFETDCLITIHCGSVAIGPADESGHPTKWLCLPAASGSGKTTLTAALTAAGFPYGSDEMIILRDDLHARPLSFPLCIKHRSWDVLASRYPNLADLPAYRRYGFHVRYLPPATPLPDPDWRPIAGFVFPRYAEDHETGLRPLDRIDGMQRLFDQCLSIPEPLDLATVGRIVELCGKLPFYELPLSDLDEAVSVLRELSDTL
jgi:hypothetical protein